MAAAGPTSPATKSSGYASANLHGPLPAGDPCHFTCVPAAVGFPRPLVPQLGAQELAQAAPRRPGQSMIPWSLIDTVQVPGTSDELRLMRRGAEFSIRLGHNELMNSRLGGSEAALATLACERIRAGER